MYKNYDDREEYEYHEYKKPCCPKPKCCPKVALNANTGGAGPLPIIALLADPINIVTTSIDTEEFCRPSILLTFTAIISIPLGALVNLNFHVVRSSDDGEVNVGPTFTFARTVAVLEAESFAFQVFDSNLAPANYTYSVRLAPSSTTTVAGLTINNATLSLLAVDEIV